MVGTIQELSKVMPVAVACQAMDFPRSTFYRQTSSPLKKAVKRQTKRRSSRALDDVEREKARALLNSDRFQDCSPYTVYTILLDEGEYLCSISTMYRILREYNEVRERRNQRQLPVYAKPELLATGPNQLWSWDISWLRGPVRGSYYYLYVILDVFSRYVVGWTIANVESAELAEQLIDFACANQRISKQQLTLHSDRGPAMMSIPVAHLLEQLGVAKSHSRPYTSDDNPYSEAHFKTLKYRHDYPGALGARFDSDEHARDWVRAFVNWYNYEHYHSGIGLIPPAALHFGNAHDIYPERQAVLDKAYSGHPERFVNGQPKPPAIPEQVWINKPKQSEAEF